MGNKISNENGELLRAVGDLENNLNMLAKAKSALGAQLNDIKALCDNEARERQLLLGKFKNLEHEVDGAKEALDEEAAVDNLQAKLAQIGKAKEKVAQEFNEMTTNLDQAQVINAAMERKAKQFDKTISEMKGKVDRLSFDLDV